MRWPIFFCFIASFTALFFGIIHVAIMRPFSAFSYILIAAGASGIIIHNAKPIEIHEFNIMANYDSICDSQRERIAELQEDMQNVINLWMCNQRCKCFTGANSEIFNLWTTEDFNLG